MKYASIDLETTGLNLETCDILEFGCILDDLNNQRPVAELARFHAYILPPADRKVYQVEPYAAWMNAAILKRIAVKEAPFAYLYPGQLGSYFQDFLKANGFGEVFDKNGPKLTCAGKNFASFDLAFLKRAPGFATRIRIAHRSFDPGSMYFRRGDTSLPGTEECCKRAGLGEITPTHTAVDDALLVIQLLRSAVNRCQVTAIPAAT